ncbi:hypothetical protein ACRJ4W_08845 [Streptomyces sp. GLT-R25]
MSAHEDGDGTDEVAEFAALLLMALKEPTARSYGPLTHRLGMNTSTPLPERQATKRREQETRQRLASPAVDRGPYEGDPEELAEQWMARHAEERRITALGGRSGLTRLLPGAGRAGQYAGVGARCAAEGVPSLLCRVADGGRQDAR